MREGPDGQGAHRDLEMGRWTPPWAPEVGALWIRGVAPTRPGVAVVGARASDPYGLWVAARCAEAAHDLGRAVVSGGAEGCDRAAHEAALARKGTTIVVLAGGLDRAYPREHGPLFEAVVAQGGALVSACPPGTAPRPRRFLERNRLIVTLSSAVIVARARARSGALSTARAARDQGRPLLAVPGPVGRALSEGVHGLLHRGAAAMTGPGALALALASARDTRERGCSPWPITDEPVPAPLQSPPEKFFLDEVTHSPEGEAVLGALRQHRALDLAGLSRLTRLSVSAVLSLLVELEIDGRVAQEAGQFRLTQVRIPDPDRL